MLLHFHCLACLWVTGASVGKNVTFCHHSLPTIGPHDTTPTMPMGDLTLLKICDGVLLSDEAILSTWQPADSPDIFQEGPILLSRNAKVCALVTIGPTTFLGEGSCLEPGCAVEGVKIPAGRFWSGVPAKDTGRRRDVLSVYRGGLGGEFSAPGSRIPTVLRSLCFHVVDFLLFVGLPILLWASLLTMAVFSSQKIGFTLEKWLAVLNGVALGPAERALEMIFSPARATGGAQLLASAFAQLLGTVLFVSVSLALVFALFDELRVFFTCLFIRCLDNRFLGARPGVCGVDSLRSLFVVWKVGRGCVGLTAFVRYLWSGRYLCRDFHHVVVGAQPGYFVTEQFPPPVTALIRTRKNGSLVSCGACSWPALFFRGCRLYGFRSLRFFRLGSLCHGGRALPRGVCLVCFFDIYLVDISEWVRFDLWMHIVDVVSAERRQPRSRCIGSRRCQGSRVRLFVPRSMVVSWLCRDFHHFVVGAQHDRIVRCAKMGRFPEFMSPPFAVCF